MKKLKRDHGRFAPGIRYSKKTEFKKGQHWRPHQPFRDKRFLIKEYIVEKKSSSDIAKRFNVTEAAIIYWLRKQNIHRRTISESRKTKHWGSFGPNNPMFGLFGKNNPNYIDGSTPLRQKMYSRVFWKRIIRFVYKRDNYRCLRCGAVHSKNNILHAHHILPWAGNPSERFNLLNIITLCSKCHRWVHSKANKNADYIKIAERRLEREMGMFK